MTAHPVRIESLGTLIEGDETLTADSTYRARRRQRDLTTGSLTKQILQLSVPSAAEQALFALSGLVHAYWLGRVGGLALAAITMGTTLRIALISPMMGLSAGGMAVVARHVGAGEQRRADHAVAQVILLIVAFVVPLAIIGQLMGPTFLRWMGAKGELLESAVDYVRIIFGGLLFMEMLPTMNGVIRAAGHPEYTLRINIVNIAVMVLVASVLVPGLGPFPALGVRGAGWAAVVGSASGVAAQLVTLASGRSGVRLHLADVRPDLPTMGRVLRIAVPTAAQRFSPNLANAVLMKLVSALGDQVLVAYSLMTRLSGFLQCPSFGLGSAAATMVGQNLGAKQPRRAQRATMLAARAAIGCGLVLFSGLNIWPASVLGVFERNQAVVAVGLVAARYLLFSGTAMAWSMVMGSALVAAGDAVAAMLVSIGSMWLVQLPLCWALSGPLNMGAQGIWAGLVASYLVGAVVMTLRFRQGRWKEIRV